MISLNNIAQPQDVQTLADLVALMAEPKKSAALIADFQKESARFREAVEAMAATQRGFTAAEAEHQQALAKATADHEAALKKARQRFDQERLQVENGLAAREKRVADLETKAAEAAAANEATRGELERRLAHLKAAAA